MRKADIRVQLGLNMMAIDRTLTVRQVQGILDKYFKRKTIAQMCGAIQRDGGWKEAAKNLVIRHTMKGGE